MITQDSPTKFPPLQQELLKLYSMDLSEIELKEVKMLLDAYFLERLQKKIINYIIWISRFR